MGAPERNDAGDRGAELDSLPRHELGAQLGATAEPGRRTLRRSAHAKTLAARLPDIQLETRPSSKGTPLGEAPGTTDEMRRPMLEANLAAAHHRDLLRTTRVDAQQ